MTHKAAILEAVDQPFLESPCGWNMLVPALPQTPAAGENCLAAQHVRRVPWGLAWASGETWSKTNKSLPILHNSTMFSISFYHILSPKPCINRIQNWEQKHMKWDRMRYIPIDINITNYYHRKIPYWDNLSTSFNLDVFNDRCFAQSPRS